MQATFFVFFTAPTGARVVSSRFDYRFRKDIRLSRNRGRGELQTFLPSTEDLGKRPLCILRTSVPPLQMWRLCRESLYHRAESMAQKMPAVLRKHPSDDTTERGAGWSLQPAPKSRKNPPPQFGQPHTWHNRVGSRAQSTKEAMNFRQAREFRCFAMG